MELEINDDRIECLWVRIRGKANKTHILVAVCCRPLNQDKEIVLFYKQLEDVSRLPALVLVGDFSLPDTCWELNTAEEAVQKVFNKCEE